MSAAIIKKLGKDMAVGTVFIPWYEKTACIAGFKDYTGNLKIRGGSRIAILAPGGEWGGKEFLIHNEELYLVVELTPSAAAT